MIRIITDSTSDISGSESAKLNIDVVPLSVVFGEESFKDGIELTSREFYHRLAAAKDLPTTSQINPGDFYGVFKQYTDNDDEVLGIFLSKALSGTYQSATIAKDEVNCENIILIDAQSTTFGLKLIVLEAVKLRDQGKSINEIKAVITALIPKIRLFAVVDTLKYLKMGGRISATAAAVGGVLGICPIISVIDGKVEAVGKGRGRKGCFRRIEEMMKISEPNMDYTFAFGHTNSPEALEECKAYFLKKHDITNYVEGSIGAVIGTHAGPGAVGIAYFAK